MPATHFEKSEFDALKNDGRKTTPRIVSGMDQPVDLKPLGLRGRAIFRQVLMVMLGNLGVFVSGMGLAVPAVTLSQLQDTSQPVYLDKDQASWYASFNTVACPIGGLIVSYVLDRYGRKNTLFLVNFFAVLAWGLMAVATQTSNESFFLQLLISRFIIGIATGLASAPVSVYSAEISHAKIRGRLILGTSISIATGILLMFVLGYFIRNDWRLLCMISCGYSFVTGLLVIPMPESPSWLMTKGRKEEARQSLRYFRGLKSTDQYTCEEFETEYNALEKSLQKIEGVKKPPLFKMLKEPEVYKPILLVIGLFFFQQCSGIFVVIVYAVQFSIEAGVTIDPILCAIFIGLARVLTTCCMGPILDKLGRRPPALFSSVGMAICMFLLAANSWFPSFSMSYLPVVAIVVFIVTSTLGLMTLPFVMMAEVFPQKVRGAGAGITFSFGLGVGFVIIKLFPNMVASMGRENVFAFYGCMAILSILYMYFLLPETKGKTLLEIEEHFKYGGKRSRIQTEMEVEMKEVFVDEKK